ncbi:unnamed protein product, partial [Adineta steineri]
MKNVLYKYKTPTSDHPNQHKLISLQFGIHSKQRIAIKSTTINTTGSAQQQQQQRHEQKTNAQLIM